MIYIYIYIYIHYLRGLITNSTNRTVFTLITIANNTVIYLHYLLKKQVTYGTSNALSEILKLLTVQYSSYNTVFSFLQASLSESCLHLGQIMSANRYPCIFSRKIPTIVYLMVAFMVLPCGFSLLSDRF